MDVVFAMADIPTPVGRVRKGSHWPASDPLVAQHRAMFSSDPRYGLQYTEPPPGFDAELNEVEEATANPGERRSVRRGA